jgi:hypothetical protein
MHKESQPKRFQKKGQRKERDFSSYQWYHCENIGHIARHCPTSREEYKRKNKRHYAHAVEDEEPPAKMIREHIEDYDLILTLLGSVSPGDDTWLIDSGAYKHMIDQRDILSCLSKKIFS